MSIGAYQTSRLPQSYIDEFLTDLEWKGRRQQTIASYRLLLERFFRDVRVQPERVTSQDVKRWLMQESERGNKTSTISTKVAGLRSFFGWMAKEDYITKNPMLRIDKPRVQRPAPKYLTHDEIEALREAAQGNQLDELIVEVLYSTGLRVSELVKLDWHDIDWETKMVRVRDGKGGKSRVVPISTKAIRFLRKYRKTRRDDKPWVLRSQYDKRMSKATIEWRIKRLGEKAGIQSRVTPHRLRHSLGTHLLQAGVRIDAIQRCLGHSNISTTQIYAITQMADVEQQYRRVMP